MSEGSHLRRALEQPPLKRIKVFIGKNVITKYIMKLSRWERLRKMEQ